MITSKIIETHGFKIGDFVKIKDQYKDFIWYTDETYQIKSFDELNGVLLDRGLPYELPTHLKYADSTISITTIKLDNVYYRNKKILKLKECLK